MHYTHMYSSVGQTMTLILSHLLAVSICCGSFSNKQHEQCVPSLARFMFNKTMYIDTFSLIKNWLIIFRNKFCLLNWITLHHSYINILKLSFMWKVQNNSTKEHGNKSFYWYIKVSVIAMYISYRCTKN